MAALDVNKIKIVERALHQPSLEELKEVVRKPLEGNFQEVEVEVVDCPDLTQQPFTLAAKGLGGNTKVLEVGGPPFLLPTVQKDKLYNIQDLLKKLNYGNKDVFVVGAGAGPWPYINSNCEMMMNVVVSPDSKVKSETRIASVSQTNGSCVLEKLPDSETKFALLANLFASEGKPSKVLKVRAKKRTGSDDFIACMQKAIAARYQAEGLVGLGGTFLIKEGKVKQHVMPPFSEVPLNTPAKLDNWLNFYNMSAPLVAVGTFVSAETELDLRVQHFHSFSHHGEGGHYHIDTTPEDVEYIGYFNVGATLYRVDQPPAALQFGKD